jgi:hypothetical protein
MNLEFSQQIFKKTKISNIIKIHTVGVELLIEVFAILRTHLKWQMLYLKMYTIRINSVEHTAKFLEIVFFLFSYS